MSGLIIEQYSEKILLVKGETAKYKENLKAIKGTWNPTLKGWIFPITRKAEVEALQKGVNSGTLKPLESPDNKQWVSVKDYLALLSRVERLETLIGKPPQVSCNDIDTVESEEEDAPVKGLLKKKK